MKNIESVREEGSNWRLLIPFSHATLGAWGGVVVKALRY